MRNLLGRLNARKPDDLQRIARFWDVPLARDRSRQVGVLYRTMSDVRAARTVIDRLTPDERRVVDELAVSDAGALTIADLAVRTGLDETATRDAAIRLFHNGLIAREGDSQELPVGALPKLFMPRELGLVFRRVRDEIDAGDISGYSLRVLLETRDQADLEEIAGHWGINVIPGLRSRDELVGQILRQISPERIKRALAALSREAQRIWTVFEEESIGGILLLSHVINHAGLESDDPAQAARVRDALDELEMRLLVLHTYDRQGRRALFVPDEILHPETTPATLPMKPLTPVPEDQVGAAAAVHPHAVAWDLLTVLREIANHGAPIWVPGEPVSRTWQRRLNGRLWFRTEDAPPEGYLGLVLQLALNLGLLLRTPPPPGTHADRNAIVPAIAAQAVREWRSRTFAQQSARLRRSWLTSDAWIEARERDDVEVWGPDWQGFRRKLLESVATMDPHHWLLLREFAQRLAETDPALIGTSMTVANAGGGGEMPEGERDRRLAATALIIRLEFETALTWFGFVDTGRVPKQGRVVRLSGHGAALAREPEAVDETTPSTGPAIEVTEDGVITLLQPAPVHIWSLTAFADADEPAMQPVYRLRSGSVGRALGAGFELEQIEAYLAQQGGHPLPEALRAKLREWSAGYRRVRLRRAMTLTADAGTPREDLERIIHDAGMELQPGGDESVLVALYPYEESAAKTAEDALLAALRASGYLGQWAARPVARRPRDA